MAIRQSNHLELKGPQSFPKNPFKIKMEPIFSTIVFQALKIPNLPSAPKAFSRKMLKPYTMLYSALSSQSMVNLLWLRMKLTNLKNLWAGTISVKFRVGSGDWLASWTWANILNKLKKSKFAKKKTLYPTAASNSKSKINPMGNPSVEINSQPLTL